MVPGSPVSAVACRYRGLIQPYEPPQPSFALARSAPVATVGKLVADLNSLPALPALVGGVFNCPADSGDADLVILGYRNGAQLTVTASLAGCRFVSNGDTNRRGNPTLWADLSALVGDMPTHRMIPLLEGLNVASATSELEADGLRARMVSERNPNVAAGTVFAASPDTGAIVDPNSVVTLTVSSGP